jgi:hypothetical protein
MAYVIRTKKTFIPSSKHLLVRAGGRAEAEDTGLDKDGYLRNMAQKRSNSGDGPEPRH